MISLRSVPKNSADPNCTLCNGTGIFITNSTTGEGTPCQCPAAGDVPPKKESTAINPSHYADARLSPIEYMELNDLSEAFCLGNIIKYTMRARAKNGVEDYRKAVWYLHYLIGKAEGLEGSAITKYARTKTEGK